MRIKLCLAGVALLGTAAPVVAIAQLPNDLPFLAVTVGGLAVSLVFYVLLIRTRAMSVATGIALAVIAVGLPVPGYPIYFFGVRYGFAAEGLLLFAIPPLCLLAWLVGFGIDVAQRSSGRDPEPPAASIA